ncbi:hypothetical protein IMCC3317_34410 [Kordia antarctica]|uniref:Uncharacterized protein n=1 Tax=Kordia antarctica TaxID=1218801 RepID=A0A7L4ZNL2_9FLAO|nr:hypothetical protein [Kordia antarctica]QHI38057.1 hypothetical protein IMCC3317_34410 [Kordia antarctica]
MVLNQNKSRNIITITWLFFFTINLVILLYLYLDNWLYYKDILIGLKTISTTYGGYLGIIIAFHFSKKIKEDSQYNVSSFYISLFCSVIWNIVITLFLFRLALGKGYFEHTIELISDIAAMFSWLVGGVIGYFFAKNS